VSIFFTSVSARIESWVARKDVAALLAVLEPTGDDLILDVGAGYGWIADQVAHTCNHLIALEPDQKRIRQMRRNHSHLTVVSAVEEALPFRASIFDKIYLRRSFHHLSDQEESLKELERVMNASGSLLIQELSPERKGKLISSVERLLRGVHVQFLTPADLRTKLERHGFRVKLTKPAVAGYFLVVDKKNER
jgi:ubiquinone/menaquinone biosynthesis C-methylase UbiE